MNHECTTKCWARHTTAMPHTPIEEEKLTVDAIIKALVESSKRLEDSIPEILSRYKNAVLDRVLEAGPKDEYAYFDSNLTGLMNVTQSLKEGVRNLTNQEWRTALSSLKDKEGVIVECLRGTPLKSVDMEKLSKLASEIKKFGEEEAQ